MIDGVVRRRRRLLGLGYRRPLAPAVGSLDHKLRRADGPAVIFVDKTHALQIFLILNFFPAPSRLDGFPNAPVGNHPTLVLVEKKQRNRMVFDLLELPGGAAI